jgi:hypothetical protein
MADNTVNYPTRLTIDYPDRSLNRLTSFFRIFTVIPIGIVLSLMGGRGSTSILFFPTLLMLLFQHKYPKWWFDWNLAMTKFGTRVLSYLSLFTDVYPSTDEEQAVHLEITYPDAKKDLTNWYPLVKWFLAIPHYIILYFLTIAACVCVVLAWFAILFTGRYPRGLFDFVAGVYKWDLRVTSYAFILSTDQYPPFSMD